MQYTTRAIYEYISRQTADPIVERKTCRVSGQPFPIYQSDLDFYAKISPTFAGQKFQIPTPTVCPEERQRRRLSFRNERKLYKRKCDATGENIISNYSPDKKYTVYSIDYWRSDKWDPMKYGQNFLENQSFFEQYNNLINESPHISLMVKMNENCNYVNGCGNSKNCYLVFDTDFCVDSLYSSILKHSTNIVDSLNIYYCDTVYQSINCTESFSLFSCYECDQSKFLYNCSLCSGCSYCISCTNLVNKQHCINNIQFSEEERKKQFSYENKKLSYLQRATYKVNDEGGNGNNLYGTKNCVFSYNIGFSENLKYCDLVTDMKNSYDISSFGGTSEFSIDCISIGLDCSRIYYSNVITAGCHSVFYSTALVACHDMFGCTFMKNKSYCIFNKQYTKEEYEKQVAKIIAHMQVTGERGEFFDPSLSPFGYNETIAEEYFPLTKEESSKSGYKRSDYNADPVIPAGAQTLQGEQIPTDITAVSDDILKSIFMCEVSGRPFRIIKQELEFYRKHNLPLPRKHPDVRHDERMKLRPGRILHLRTCDCCEKEMLSVYPQIYEGKVYCEECYKKEIYA